MIRGLARHVPSARTLSRLAELPQLRPGRKQPHCPRSLSTTPFNRRTYSSWYTASTIAIVIFSGLTVISSNPPSLAETSTQAKSTRDTRLIRLKEIRQHGRDADTFWVYRGDRVYDITDWVPNHPGGEVILRACGGGIEPYWNVFSIHQNQDVYDILEQYFIGKIDPRDLVDGKAPQSQIDDPFSDDPERDDALIVHTRKPCNAETPLSSLDTFLTPLKVFYVRHHLWVPKVEDVDTYRLRIELPDGEEVEYSLADLRQKFTQHTITATLQCSGNRRRNMSDGSRKTSGLQWDVGAISNAEWTGVRLRDVLADAGLDVNEIPQDVKHAQFVGSEAYGASIPIRKACDPYGDVLLCHTMNGCDLPRDHGYPLRVLVPGHVAARSVKWLNKIILSEEESPSQWQQRDYKCFGPNVSNPDWDSAPAIQETPVQSAITSVSRMSTDQMRDSQLARVYGLEQESIVVSGYAISGGGRRIVRVDVSPDDGRTWEQATLKPLTDAGEAKGRQSWSWHLWTLALPVSRLRGHICVKAVDEANNSQPEEFEAQWNVRGNLSNAWHRIPVSDHFYGNDEQEGSRQRHKKPGS